MRLIDEENLGICKANPEAFIKPEYAYGWNAAIEAIKAAPIIDAVPVDKMELQQFSIDTQTRTAKAVFRFGDKRITLCGDCGEFAPVAHGRWVHLGGDEWCCSACGNVIHTEGSWEKPDENYCPNCGAKMDLEAGHEP